MPAEETVTPGLYVHGTIGDRSITVTHGPTGLGIATFPDKEIARKYAQWLGELGNWNVQFVRDSMLPYLEVIMGVASRLGGKVHLGGD